jgi:hypothetical protein
VLLGAHEQVMRSAYALLDKGSHDPDRRRAGVLYLTTERVIFEAPRSRGVVRDLLGGQDVDLLIDVPIGALRNVVVRRGRLARPRLVLDSGGHRAVLDVLEPEAWASEIAEARGRNSPKTTLPPDPLLATGEPVVKLRCRYCGGLAAEVDRRCPACGAPL